MNKKSRHSKPPKNKAARPDSTRTIAGLRIIGGRFRGRKLQYSGDLRTRPMKDRLREAVFNLVGPAIQGKHVVDLFAGTGALALEALSRGADRATLIEQHHPTAAVIRRNIATLGLEQQTELRIGSAFLHGPAAVKGSGIISHSRDDHGRNHSAESGEEKDSRPLCAVSLCAVFCSPPYEFFVGRREEMLRLIAELLDAMPVGSVFVVEADARFDFQLLPDPQAWDVRAYAPAVVGIYRKGP